jgi:hypothetical protein
MTYPGRDVLIISDLHGNYLELTAKMVELGYWRYLEPEYIENQKYTHIECTDSCPYTIQLGDFFHNGDNELNTLPRYNKYRDRNDYLISRVSYLFDEILLGNHEIFYYRNYFLDVGKFAGMATCINSDVQRVIDERQTKLATTVGPYLITHAGLDQFWIDQYYFDIQNDVTKIANRLNERFQNYLAVGNAAGNHWPDITSVGWASGGSADVSGCLWLRPQEITAKSSVLQIVGHTPKASHPMLNASLNYFFTDNDGISLVLYKHEDHQLISL